MAEKLPSLFSYVTREQKFLIVSTFGIGILAGAVFYLTIFAPKFHDGIFPNLFGDSSRSGGLTVEGLVYGACLDSGLTCASYQLAGDGELHIEPPTGLDSDPVVFTFTLSDERLLELENAVADAPLSEYAVETLDDDCQSVIGKEYRFIVEYDDESYTLDTCRSEFPSGSELADLLISLFDETPA